MKQPVAPSATSVWHTNCSYTLLSVFTRDRELVRVLRPYIPSALNWVTQMHWPQKFHCTNYTAHVRIPCAIGGLHQRSIGQIHWRTSCSGGHCATHRIALVHDVRSACNCLSSTTCLRQLTFARVKPPYTTVQCSARSMPSVAREAIRHSVWLYSHSVLRTLWNGAPQVCT